MKNLIAQFNKPDSMLVITSYPGPSMATNELTAVAWHSKRTVAELAKQGNRVIVLAQKTGDAAIDAIPHHVEKNILVLYVWEKGSIKALIQIAKATLKFESVHQVLFQFEFNLFGGTKPVALLPFLLAFLRLVGKTITFELHQVISDISTLSTHINIKKPLLLKLFNFGLSGFYRTIGFFSKNIIVFETHLKTVLSTYVDPKKIVVIPLAVSTKKTISPSNARKVLGLHKKDFVILAFGFVNWYKGSDWIVRTIARTKMRNIRLVLAGGESATLKNQPYYQQFYKDVARVAAKSNKIIHTNFVPERHINRYFAASDVVVFPYRVFMSSSGPLAHALAHQKPVLFSSNITQYFQSEDVKRALKKSGIGITDVVFNLDSRDFTNKIKAIRENASGAQEFSKSLAQSRSIEEVAKQYSQLLNSAPPDFLPIFRILFANK